MVLGVSNITGSAAGFAAGTDDSGPVVCEDTRSTVAVLPTDIGLLKKSGILKARFTTVTAVGKMRTALSRVLLRTN
jgi:hypothetical protein